MSTHEFSTLRTAALLDFLADAVDAARVAATDNVRWLNAIDAAWDHLLQQDVIEFDAAAHALVYRSESGTTYHANGVCQCRAFAEGQACKHRAAARLVRRALELRDIAAEAIDSTAAEGDALTPAQARRFAQVAHAEVMDVAARWDAESERQRLVLGQRIGRAQAAAMGRPLRDAQAEVDELFPAKAA